MRTFSDPYNVPGWPWTPGQHPVAGAADELAKDLRVIRPKLRPYVDEWFKRKANDLAGQLAYFGSLDSAENFSGLMKRYLMRFSKTMFCGLLGPHNCQLRVIMKEGETREQWANANQGQGLWGQASLQTLENGRRIVVIDIYQRFNHGNPEAQILNYLGTLLHEMSHAFLFIISNEPAFGKPANCSFSTGYGQTGHGVPWLKVAGAVEKFSRHVLMLPISLGRPKELLDELRLNKISIDQLDFSKVGMGRAEFLNQIRFIFGPQNSTTWNNHQKTLFPATKPPGEQPSDDEEMEDPSEDENAEEDASEYEDMEVDSTDDDDVEESSDEEMLDVY